MKIALQLYSVRDCIQSGEDMRAVMKKIKAMGYEGVEFAGYAGLSPQEVKAALDEAGLLCYSHGEYFGVKKKPVGRFGFSVMKAKTRKRINRENWEKQRKTRKRRD